jgi:hypothetical protein
MAAVSTVASMAVVMVVMVAMAATVAITRPLRRIGNSKGNQRLERPLVCFWDLSLHNDCA